MARGWCRRLAAAMAAGAAMGMVPLCSAQQLDIASMDSPALLATMEPQKVQEGAGVFYSKLAGHSVYFISDGVPSRPASIVISNSDKAKLSAAKFRQMGERFRSLYKLNGYQMILLEDSSALFFLRETGLSNRQSSRRNRAMQALAERKSLVPAILWLNVSSGGLPVSMRGSRLTWSKEVWVGRQVCELMMSLDLSRGAPCYVELSLPGVLLNRATDVFSDHLDLKYDAMTTVRSSSLRRRIGAKPLRLMEGKVGQGRRQRQVELCLVGVPSESWLYRLGEVSTLYRLRELPQETTLPEVPDMPWVDELAAGKRAGATTPAQAGETAPAAEEKPVPAAPAPLTPEEARKAYAERLKSL